MQQIADDIPPSLVDADDVLTRYARWAQQRRGPRRCGSAEGAYRPSGIAALEDRSIPAPQLLPLRERVAAQRALSRVPEAYRDVLVVLYIPQGRQPAALLRAKCIPPRTCRERHIPALQIFWNIYQTLIQ